MSDDVVETSKGIWTHVYWPHNSSAFSWQRSETPVIVLFVGGGWEIRKAEHESYQKLAQLLSNQGYMVMIPEFRRVGLGYCYLFTLLPLHAFMFTCLFYCMFHRSHRVKMKTCFILGLGLAFLLCVFFLYGSELNPVTMLEQIDDCQKATMFTQTDNFRNRYRFQSENVFLMGYSSGANIAATLGVKMAQHRYIRGCISICGIYDMWDSILRRNHWSLLFWLSTYGVRYHHLLPIPFVDNETTTPKEGQGPRTLIITGSHESPALQRSAYHYANALIKRGWVSTTVVTLPFKDHWTILDDLLYDLHLISDNSAQIPQVRQCGLSSQVFFHIHNFIHKNIDQGREEGGGGIQR